MLSLMPRSELAISLRAALLSFLVFFQIRPATAIFCPSEILGVVNHGR